jgi:hypothetical protein
MEDQKHIENLSHAKHPRTFITKINIGTVLWYAEGVLYTDFLWHHVQLMLRITIIYNFDHKD